MKNVNPRYVAYAAAHGRSPEDMMKHDHEKYPGGCMCGFILWIRNHHDLFMRKSPKSFVGDRLWGHNAFTTYLQNQSEIEHE